MQNAAGAWMDVTLEILELGIGEHAAPAVRRRAAIRRRTRSSACERPRSNFAACATVAQLASSFQLEPARAVRSARRRAARQPHEHRQRRGERADALRRHHALHRARRAQPLALVPWRDAAAVCPAAGARARTRSTSTATRCTSPIAAATATPPIRRETGEYGNEDIVNPGNGRRLAERSSCSDTGEDFNAQRRSSTRTARSRAPVLGARRRAGALGRHDRAARGRHDAEHDGRQPGRRRAREGHDCASATRSLFFRRALKVVNGAARQPRRAGPHDRVGESCVRAGNWNSNGAGFDNTPCAANPCADHARRDALIADALTLLSSNWNDRQLASRTRTTSRSARARRRGIASRSSRARASSFP